MAYSLLMRNSEINNCDFGILSGNIHNTYENVSSFENVTLDWGLLPMASGTANNCADSDNTITTQGFAETDCIHNINASNEYRSLSDTNPLFLMIKQVSQLYNTGRDVGEETDIQGWPRPKITGENAIGSHELASGSGIYDADSEDISAEPKEGLAPHKVQFSNIPASFDGENT